jgi:3-oxoacyl-[acyl-carrier protein] reductase
MPSLPDLAGRTVAVSGVTSAFGAAIAKAFVAQGASVFGCDVDPAGFPALVSAGVGCEAVDLCDRAAAADWIEAVAAEAGALDILVNNAGGVAGQQHEPFETLSDADWDIVRAIGRDRQHLLGCVTARLAHRHPGLLRRKARASRSDTPTCARTRTAGHPGQCGCTRTCAHRRGDTAAVGWIWGRAAGGDPLGHRDAPPRHCRRDRARHAVSRFGLGRVHHRTDFERRWRQPMRERLL